MRATEGPARAIESPQLAHRGTIAELADVPGVPGGQLRFLGAGFTVDAEPATPSRPPPRLGEHSAEVLAELGYDEPSIGALKARGVVA